MAITHCRLLNGIPLLATALFVIGLNQHQPARV
jgi:hypothetical protein